MGQSHRSQSRWPTRPDVPNHSTEHDGNRSPKLACWRSWCTKECWPAATVLQFPVNCFLFFEYLHVRLLLLLLLLLTLCIMCVCIDHVKVTLCQVFITHIVPDRTCVNLWQSHTWMAIFGWAHTNTYTIANTRQWQWTTKLSWKEETCSIQSNQIVYFLTFTVCMRLISCLSFFYCYIYPRVNERGMLTNRLVKIYSFKSKNFYTWTLDCLYVMSWRVKVCPYTTWLTYTSEWDSSIPNALALHCIACLMPLFLVDLKHDWLFLFLVYCIIIIIFIIIWFKV